MQSIHSLAAGNIRCFHNDFFCGRRCVCPSAGKQQWRNLNDIDCYFNHLLTSLSVNEPRINQGSPAHQYHTINKQQRALWTERSHQTLGQREKVRSSPGRRRNLMEATSDQRNNRSSLKKPSDGVHTDAFDNDRRSQTLEQPDEVVPSAAISAVMLLQRTQTHTFLKSSAASPPVMTSGEAPLLHQVKAMSRERASIKSR